MGNKNDNIQLFILQQMRTRNTTDPRFKEIFQKLPEQPKIFLNDKIAQDPLSLLKELNKEEIALQAERNELIQNKQALQTRISEQFEIRKSQIEQHKAEILYLKQKCAALQTALETPLSK